MRLHYCPPPELFPATDRDLVADFDLVRLGGLVPSRRECVELADLTGPFEEIHYYVHKFVPREQIERDLGETTRVLAPGGKTLVSIPPKSGSKALLRLLESLYERVAKVRAPGSTTIFEGVLPRPGVAPSVVPVHELRFEDPSSGRGLLFHTRAGLFSHQRIDPGTHLLLERVGPVTGKVLDVGCGYGAIGVTMAARGGEVTMVDADVRAVKMARDNLSLNELPGHVRLGDGCEGLADASFERVLSNPPTHAGSDVLRRLFAGMVRVVRPGGEVWLVVREQLHYEKWLTELGRCDCVATAEGYKLVRVRRPG